MIQLQIAKASVSAAQCSVLSLSGRRQPSSRTVFSLPRCRLVVCFSSFKKKKKVRLLSSTAPGKKREREKMRPCCMHISFRKNVLNDVFKGPLFGGGRCFFRLVTDSRCIAITIPEQHPLNRNGCHHVCTLCASTRSARLDGATTFLDAFASWSIEVRQRLLLCGRTLRESRGTLIGSESGARIDI